MKILDKYVYPMQ